MKRKTKLIIAIIIILAISLILYLKFYNRTRFNDSYVNGNLSGNLYNEGLFCENGGTIFFSNADDGGRLYSMDSSGTKLKKLSDDNVKYINADSNYVYYVRSNSGNNDKYAVFSFDKNSLCRISRDGGKITILDPDPCIYASLIGNYIYYLHYDSTDASTELYKVKIDGSEKEKLMGGYAFTCNSNGQYFYYNSPDDGKLYQFDTKTDTSSLYYDCSCYKPIVTENNDIYYMDVSHDNAIVHTSLNSSTPVTLTEGNIELYSVYGSYIYYQRSGDDPALCVIKNDGTGFKEIAKGEYSNISITSYNIYFKDFFNGTFYSTPTSDPGELTTFSPRIVK